jgi:hypothetical protein
MTNYNNDIAHCEGAGCPLANKCKRFQYYKIWKGLEKKEYCLTPFVEPSFKNGKCENFWRYERTN